MPLGSQLAAQLPYLRRYARALTGSQVLGDALVRATLESALEDRALQAELADGRVALYRAFTKLWQGTGSQSDGAQPTSSNEAAAQLRLARVTPVGRQALLLTTVEEFSPAEAARILGLGEADVTTLVQDAIAEIDRDTATRVLIIEDEPLISMQLEDLVVALGHEVCATATTHDQALIAVGRQRPGLVLADIQLADGSSGIDAVADILAQFDVPVIFVTAYPERLLRGDRPEPTYLVTKPFHESGVRATIAQALFFHLPDTATA